jgi:hypothetical protein
MAVKERLEAENRLICHRGHILGYLPAENGVEVTYRPRGTSEKRTFVVRQVLSCTGPQSDYRKLDDLFVRHLLERDLLAPDPLRIGARTGQDGQLIDQTGEPIDRLCTLGISWGFFMNQSRYRGCAPKSLRNRSVRQLTNAKPRLQTVYRHQSSASSSKKRQHRSRNSATIS